jgi:CDGSH-type Zn-finger protein
MPDEPLSPPITIRVKRNGPYLIEVTDAARVRIAGARDEALTPAPGRIALCRCGGSSTKPFCDGTHKRNGFTDPAAPEVEAEAVSTGRDRASGDGGR